MPTVCQSPDASLANILYSLVILYVGFVSATTTTVTRPPSSPSTISTCNSRDVNYITHRLTPQCLRSSWSPEQVSQTVERAGAAKTNLHDIEVSVTSATMTVPKFETAAADSANAPTIEQPAEIHMNEDNSSASSAASTTEVQHEQKYSSQLETDDDSLLDNSNFMSFEEWKNQNLAKAGQAGENIGERRRNIKADAEARRHNINDAIDSLGEENEIDLDFGGFVGAAAGPPWSSETVRAEDARKPVLRGEKPETPNERPRNKDAGTTCKERFNYASFENCGANILNKNLQARGPKNILVESKDSYLLNECSASNKFLIVELCDDILVDTVVLANFEFFSSTFRAFKVSVSSKYPVKLDKWVDLGTYEARNTREVQAFLVENPLIYARYFRVEFLSHYGNEYFCPVSLLRVHGTTMIEEFRREQAAAGDDEADDEGDVAAEAGEAMIPEAVAVEKIEQGILDAKQHSTKDIQSSPLPQKVNVSQHRRSVPEADLHINFTPLHDFLRHLQMIGFDEYEFNVCYFYEHSGQSEDSSASQAPKSSTSSDLAPTPTTSASMFYGDVSASATATISISQTTKQKAGSMDEVHTDDELTYTNPNRSSKRAMTQAPSAATNEPNIKSISTIPSTAASVKPSSHSVSNEKLKQSGTASYPPPPNPTTQESFFKSMHKRLQLLEVNATLSLQYIEEQSRILRDAFMKVEKRQLSKTTNFLENLNTTVLAELKVFRQQYEQIWQSTVIELENQREQSAREIIAVSARLSILADEVLYQKRMATIQTIILILCLGIIIFSRGAANSYLELPLVQNMMTKSQSFRYSSESPDGSPGPTRPTSSSSRLYRVGSGIFGYHRRNRSSEYVYDGPESPNSEFSPPPGPTRSPPERQDSDLSYIELENERGRSSPSPSESPEDLRLRLRPEMIVEVPSETQSSPATPSGTRQRKKSPLSWRDSELSENMDLLRPDMSPESFRVANGRSSPLRFQERVDVYGDDDSIYEGANFRQGDGEESMVKISSNTEDLRNEDTDDSNEEAMDSDLEKRISSKNGDQAET